MRSFFFLTFFALIFARFSAAAENVAPVAVEPQPVAKGGYTPANWRDFYEQDDADKALKRLQEAEADFINPPINPPGTTVEKPRPPVANAALIPAMEIKKPEAMDFFNAKEKSETAPTVSINAAAATPTKELSVSDAREEKPATAQTFSATVPPTADANLPTRTFVLPHPQSVDYENYYGADAVLSPKEAKQVYISDSWAGSNAPSQPMNVNGAVTFAFGLEQPSIVCAVFQVTDIELQADEVVQSVIVGDIARWAIDAMISHGNTPHIVVKPIDSGLSTSMVVATDRRTYHFALKSSRKNYLSRVKFTYPQEVAEKFAAQKRAAEAKAQAERERNTIPETNEYLGDLNFNYSGSGKAVWKPTRVFTDGKKTIIEMPRVLGGDERPALLIKQNGEETLVNYRVQGDRYIVDAIFSEAILIAGVGRKQQKITIKFLDYGASVNTKGTHQ